ncbi:hypothetical protein, partial [Klebsiella oxytoca]|uniref:hypothetical protein n=1 Tax=Klebsiella oxytoca TaxID=571 RepID=UPI00163DAE37
WAAITAARRWRPQGKKWRNSRQFPYSRQALLPGAALNTPCPGYRFTTVCGPVAHTIHRHLRAPFTAVCCWVARTDAQHRLREILPHCAPLPGAALNAPCPGYRFTAVCKPVTPTIHRRLQVW